MRRLTAAVLPLLLAAAFAPGAAAQGRSHEAPGHQKKHEDRHEERGHARAVTVDDAVVTTRDVLVRRGYEVVRVEPAESYTVVYYRAGNRGRGKGKGKLEKMIVRRSEERVVLVDAPSDVLVDVRLRLHL